VVIGGLTGGVVGAVLAVNVVIYAGIDRGYEATIPDVFRESTVIGVVAVALLVTGPVVGVVLARRLRDRRTGRGAGHDGRDPS